MNQPIFLFFVLLFLLVIGVFGLIFRLTKTVQKLAARIDQLETRLEAMKNDLSGLCSGAVGVDHRVSSNEKRVRALVERLEELEADDQDDEVKTYQKAIQMAQQGCSEEELVNQFKLTADEAALLIRLYRMQS